MFYKMVVYGSKIQYRLTFTRKRIINKPNQINIYSEAL